LEKFAIETVIKLNLSFPFIVANNEDNMFKVSLDVE